MGIHDQVFMDNREVYKEYFDKVEKDVDTIFKSPISKLANFYDLSLEYNHIIEIIIESSYEKAELRELRNSSRSGMLSFAVDKRIEEISNAECFILNIPD